MYCACCMKERGRKMHAWRPCVSIRGPCVSVLCVSRAPPINPHPTPDQNNRSQNPATAPPAALTTTLIQPPNPQPPSPTAAATTITTTITQQNQHFKKIYIFILFFLRCTGAQTPLPRHLLRQGPHPPLLRRARRHPPPERRERLRLRDAPLGDPRSGKSCCVGSCNVRMGGKERLRFRLMCGLHSLHPSNTHHMTTQL